MNTDKATNYKACKWKYLHFFSFTLSGQLASFFGILFYPFSTTTVITVWLLSTFTHKHHLRTVPPCSQTAVAYWYIPTWTIVSVENYLNIRYMYFFFRTNEKKKMVLYEEKEQCSPWNTPRKPVTTVSFLSERKGGRERERERTENNPFSNKNNYMLRLSWWFPLRPEHR